MAWYLTIAEAAEVTGISEKMLRDFVNGIDPPPHIKAGKKVLLNMEGLKEYLKAKEV